MLDEITARNLGLIEDAAVRLSPGLTVITGETGTGKTLMLGALRLLRGDKAGKGVVGPAGPSCDVSARFVLGDRELVVRRTVDESRSRAYIDGAAATAGALAEALAGEVAIIGQHDQLSITGATGVRTLIDRQLDAEGRSAKDAYTAAWNNVRRIIDERDAIGSDTMALERERDVLAFQIDEIASAALIESEDDELRTRVLRLRNADALAVELGSALDRISDDGAGRELDAAAAALGRAAAMDPSLDPLVASVRDLSTLLSDRAAELASALARLDADPGLLEETEARIAVVASLKRKYGASVEDVLTFQKAARERHDAIEELIVSSTTIDARLFAAQTTLMAAGTLLLTHRRTAARTIADAAHRELCDLGFRDPIVRIDVEPADPAASGADRPTILFASDAALTPAPVSAIASGGELSRLVLALTIGAGAADASFLAFDEIDTGVGGTTALAMGEKLAALSNTHQVVCVTHLPQVAAFADVHLTVTRTGSTATLTQLDADGRIGELTRMLAGLTDSEKGREHVEELLARAGSTRSA